MGLFTKSKPSEGSGKSWIPEAIEFELGDSNNPNNNDEESASELGASNLGASLSSAFLLDGVGDNDGRNTMNSRRPPPPPAAKKGP